MLLRRQAILALATAGVLAACGTVEETLTPRLLATCFHSEAPLERTTRTSAEWQALAALHQRPLPAVDFATEMVAVHLDGGGSACVRFGVDDVQVTSERVIVGAVRHSAPGPCIAILAFPQVVVALPQRDLPVVFRIRDVSDNGGDTVRCP